MYFDNCKYDQSFNKPCKLKTVLMYNANSRRGFTKKKKKKKKTEETAKKTIKYTMGRGAAFDGPFI